MNVGNLRTKVRVFGESITYSFAVFLFMLAGYLLHLAEKVPSAPGAVPPASLYAVLDERGLATLLVGSVIYVIYFLLRLALLDQPPDIPEVEIATLWMWSAIAGAAALVVGSMYVSRYGWGDVAYLCGALPPTVLLVKSVASRLSADPTHVDPSNRFVPKIFYPVFSVCFLAFLAGWGVSEPSYVEQVVYMSFLLGITSIFMIGLDRVPTQKIALVFLLAAAFSAVVVQAFPGGPTYGRAVILAVLLTFATGFGEVGKRPYLIKVGRVRTNPDEDAQYYESGANWSSILFLSLAPLTALFSAAPLVVWLAAACPAMIMAWHSIRRKNSILGRYVALAIGFSIPLLVSLLAFLSIGYGATVPGENKDLVEQLATINGIFLTILFVLYPDDFRELHRNLYDSRNFLKLRQCAIFAALVIAVEVVTVPLLVFLFDLAGKTSPDTAQKASIILAGNLIASITVFIALLLDRSGPSAQRPEGPAGSAEASAPTPGAAGSTRTLIGSLSILVRPGSSAIAGSCCVGFAAAFGPASPATCVALFVTGTLLGAYGFSVNDLFDERKDRDGGRTDKVLVAGALSPLLVAAVAYALLLGIVLASSLLGTGARSVALLLAALLTAYSAFAKRLPVLKGAYTAALCGLLPFVGALQQGATIPGWIVLVVFTYVLGREAFIDATEVGADEAARFRTIAVLLGRRYASLLGLATMSAACVLFLALSPDTAAAVAVSVMVMACLVAAAGSHAMGRDDRALLLTRLPMILLVVALGVQSGG